MEPTNGMLGRRNTTVPRRSSHFRAISVKKNPTYGPRGVRALARARTGTRGQPSHSVMILALAVGEGQEAVRVGLEDFGDGDGGADRPWRVATGFDLDAGQPHHPRLDGP